MTVELMFNISASAIIFLIIGIIFNIFIILSVRSLEDEDFLSERLFIVIGALGITSLVLYYLIPTINPGTITSEDNLAVGGYLFMKFLVIYLPSLIAYGVLFLYLGYINLEDEGRYLLIAGVLWIGDFVFNAILYINNYQILMAESVTEIQNIGTINTMLFVFNAILQLIVWSFFLMFSIRMTNLYLQIAAIIKFGLSFFSLMTLLYSALLTVF